MFRLVYLCLDMLSPVLILPPAVFFYGKYRRFYGYQISVCLLFSLYIAGVYHMTGLPDLLYYRKDVTVYLGVLVGILSDIKNSILNVLLFFPLGMFLPVICDRFRDAKRTLMAAFTVSLAIELLQMFTLRTTDINDILTNCLGGWLGFLAAGKLLDRKQSLAVHGKSEDVLFLIGAAFGVMYVVQPFVIYFLWDKLF